MVTSAKDADDGQAGKMPKYVTESGYEEFEEVRTRVGHNAPLAHKLWLVDVANSKASELKFDTLPGIKDDPLAAMRKAAKQDPLKGARDVRSKPTATAAAPAIHWSEDGRNAAVMVRAIDNKDRWLASVDLAARNCCRAIASPIRAGSTGTSTISAGPPTTRCGSCRSRPATRTCT